MEKLHKIGIPAEIEHIVFLFCKMRLWNTVDETSVMESGTQLFYFIHIVCFVISIAIGAHITNDKDESIFLAVASIQVGLQAYKLSYIIRRKVEIRSLIHRVGNHWTNDENEFNRMDKKLKRFMILPKYFMFVGCLGFSCAVLAPVATKQKRLIFNIGFLLDWKNSTTGFWIAHSFIAGAAFLSLVCCLLTITVWYLMINFVVKYEMLGNRFKTMGDRQMTSYHQDFVASIQTHEQINETIDDFSSTFSNLFLLQIVTSSICICGATYTLAFSTFDNLIQDGMNCVIISFCLFDTFMVTYLGNEIKLASDRLSYCLFESKWWWQTQLCKKLILIMTELLKRPEELVVGKLFPLNLETFTLIVKRAYSMFNVLQSLRK